MRIVLLNHYYAPDEAPTALLLADLGERLARGGHDVTAICGRRSYTDPRLRYAPRERIDGVEVRRCWSTGFGRVSHLRRVLDYATFLVGASRRLFLGRRPDLIITLTSPPMVSVLALAAARLRGARLLFWVMDVYPDLAFELGVLRERSLPGRLLRGLSRRVLRGADLTVALGPSMARRLEALGAPRVAIVHNWVDGAAIRPLPAADNALRAEWGWQRRFVVLYSGNMGLAHDFDTVLAAAEALRERGDVLFGFVGVGPRRAEVEAAVRARGLANVEFRPYVERERLAIGLGSGEVHLVSLRPRMPGLLVPSKVYGILAAGRPLLYVGPAEGEIAEILEEGRCGVRVDPGDGAALAAAIVGYAGDAGRLAEHGRRARALFERRFEREQALAGFVKLIEGLAP